MLKLSRGSCARLPQPVTTYWAAEAQTRTSPTYRQASPSHPTPAMAKNSALITGHTPARPSQLTVRSIPWRMP